MWQHEFTMQIFLFQYNFRLDSCWATQQYWSITELTCNLNECENIIVGFQANAFATWLGVSSISFGKNFDHNWWPALVRENLTSLHARLWNYNSDRAEKAEDQDNSACKFTIKLGIKIVLVRNHNVQVKSALNPANGTFSERSGEVMNKRSFRNMYRTFVQYDLIFKNFLKTSAQ